MQFGHCFGCMEQAGTYPCRHCGYDPRKEKTLPYALPCGTILNGKYVVGKVLGQGGFGITYIGWDLALECKVAIKEYFPSAQVSRTYGSGGTLQWYSIESAQIARSSGRDMFLKEARKMSRVSNIPQVVRVRDLFQQNETAYIVMDFVEGETLKNRLKRTGPLSWTEAKVIFLPAIRAMAQVHNAGLIHRDISPDNLMLQPDGSVRILDLGAAKDLSINSGASSIQVAKGGFSPLEQYTQHGGSGTWTDVYAMAATMYYSLTGVLPQPSVDRLMEDSQRWDLPGLTGLPDNVLTSLKKAMIVSPKDRTQTMEEFLTQLQAPSRKPGSVYSGKAGKEKASSSGKHKSGKGAWKLSVGIRDAIIAAVFLCFLGYSTQSGGESAPVLAVNQWEQNVLMADELNTLTDGELTPVLGSNQYMRSQIRTVTFLDSLQDAPSSRWDVSQKQNGTVCAWVKWDNYSGDVGIYDLFIGANGGVSALSCKDLFCCYTNLKSISFNGCFHTDNVTNMERFFYGCTSLGALDLKGLNTSNVLDMSGMFANCTSLQKLDIRSFNTGNVTDMGWMFASCSNLSVLNLTDIQTSKVTDVRHMFADSPRLNTAYGIEKLDFYKVREYDYFMNPGQKVNGLVWGGVRF